MNDVMVFLIFGSLLSILSFSAISWFAFDQFTIFPKQCIPISGIVQSHGLTMNAYGERCFGEDEKAFQVTNAFTFGVLFFAGGVLGLVLMDDSKPRRKRK